VQFFYLDFLDKIINIYNNNFLIGIDSWVYFELVGWICNIGAGGWHYYTGVWVRYQILI